MRFCRVLRMFLHKNIIDVFFFLNTSLIKINTYIDFTSLFLCLGRNNIVVTYFFFNRIKNNLAILYSFLNLKKPISKKCINQSKKRFAKLKSMVLNYLSNQPDFRFRQFLNGGLYVCARILSISCLVSGLKNIQLSS